MRRPLECAAEHTLRLVPQHHVLRVPSEKNHKLIRYQGVSRYRIFLRFVTRLRLVCKRLLATVRTPHNLMEFWT